MFLELQHYKGNLIRKSDAIEEVTVFNVNQ